MTMPSLQAFQFDWPRSAALATEHDAETTAAILKQQHRDAWRPHASLIRFLEDHYPQVWSRNVTRLPNGQETGEGVAWCRTRHVIQPRREDGAELVRLIGCGERPYCPACNDEAARRRGARILRKITAATPSDEDVTAYFVTIGVSQQDDTPTGRVALVTRDWKRFKSAIHEALRAAYGEHVGAFTTYQEYGQSVLVKQRPHVHALVHSFVPTSESTWSRTPMFDLTGSGRARLEDIVTHGLNKAFPEATGVWRDWGSGNDIDIRWRATPRKVAKSCKYLTRELIDLRTLHYDRFTQTVRTIPYKPNAARRTASVASVKRAFVDYAARTGAWYKTGRRGLDSAIGCLSDHDAADTIALMGRHETHAEGCWCKECSTWERAWIGEDVAPPLKRIAKKARG